MAKILLVEDEPVNQLLVQTSLSHHSVSVASTLDEARLALATESFELILLDVNLPDGSGFNFYAEIEPQIESVATAVIFLTAQADSADKVVGYRLGADDYITKPFEIPEFRARVEARLGRKRVAVAPTNQTRIGNLVFDTAANSVKFEKGDSSRVLDLAYFDFKFLYFLAKNMKRTISGADLISELWTDANGNEQALQMQIARLTKKLKFTDVTISVTSEGYRLVPIAQTKTNVA